MFHMPIHLVIKLLRPQFYWFTVCRKDAAQTTQPHPKYNPLASDFVNLKGVNRTIKPFLQHN